MTRLSGLLRGALLAASFALPALPAAAQQQIEPLGLTVTATPTVASDYLFRGISQTRNNWAFQGTLDVQHDSGVYVGAFISNAKFVAAPWNDTRQELDLLAGYRFTLGGISFDLGYIAYLYPGQDKPISEVRPQLNDFQEVGIKASYTIAPVKLLAGYNFSPNFFGRSGVGHYLEGGADVTLPFEFTASGRLGYQWIERNPVFGTPDYLWYSIGLSREITWGVTATLAWYDTTISKRDCVPVPLRAEGGQRICEGRVFFSLSKIF